MLSKIASFCMLIAGVCHLAATGLSGFSESLMLHVGAAIVLLALGFGVMRTNMRLLSWFSFVVLLVLSIATIGQISDWSAIPSSLLYGIAALDWIAIVLLFIVLWRSKPSALAA